MINKLNQLAYIKRQNWEKEEILFERRIANGVKDSVGANVLISLYIIAFLAILKHKTLIPTIIILILFVLVGNFIQKKGSISSKYIFKAFASWYLSINFFYLFIIASCYSDNATISKLSIIIYAVIILSLVIMSPLFAYRFIKNGWEGRAQLTDEKLAKIDNRNMFLISLIPGSLGFIIHRLSDNYLSLDSQFSIFRVALVYLIAIFAWVGFLYLYQGIVIYINQKQI